VNDSQLHGASNRKCPRPFLVMNTERQEVEALPCRRRTCPVCGWRLWLPRQKARFYAGIPEDIGRLQFVTLTPPASPPSDWNAGGASKSWNRLRGSVKRRSPGFEYLRVAELQRRGFVHLHVLFRDLDVPRAKLQQAAERAGFGREVDFRPVTDVPGICSYLTKDTLRAVPAFRRRRVLCFSRHWDLSAGPRPERSPKPLSKIDFHFEGRGGSVSWRNGDTECSMPLSDAEGLLVAARERWDVGEIPPAVLPADPCASSDDGASQG